MNRTPIQSLFASAESRLLAHCDRAQRVLQDIAEADADEAHIAERQDAVWEAIAERDPDYYGVEAQMRRVMGFELTQEQQDAVDETMDYARGVRA